MGPDLDHYLNSMTKFVAIILEVGRALIGQRVPV